MNRLAAPVATLAIAALAVAVLAAVPAAATPMAYGTGLANPAITLDFGSATVGVDISTLYQAADGVTFGGLYGASAFGTLGSSVSPEAANYSGTTTNRTFTIAFATPQTDAAFFLYTDGFGTTIASSLAGAPVETTSAGTYAQNTNDYFGFTGSRFDAITLTVAGNTGDAFIDNLEIGNAALPVPEPGSQGILLAGLAGLVILGTRRRSL